MTSYVSKNTPRIVIEPLAVIDARLKEAHELFHATHNYIKWQAPLDIKNMDIQKTFKVSCEAMRVTIRMIQIIAWLTLQKSVLAGEISQKEFMSEDCRVLQGGHCLENDSELDEDIPPRLRELLKESRQLYVRILRLDKTSRTRSVSPTPPPKIPPLKSSEEDF